MKNKFSLSVKKPCSENWSNFSKTTTGGFCNSCEKNVVDFSKMTDSEIISFFSSKPAHVCGRFQPSQLRTYDEIPEAPARGSLKWVSAGILSTIMFLQHGQAIAQTSDTSPIQRTEQPRKQKKGVKLAALTTGTKVKGRVLDSEINEPLPGANVYLKGSSIAVMADVDGYFSFPQELNAGDVLVVCYIGYSTMEYVVPKSDVGIPDLNIALTLDVSVLGEVAVDHLYVAKANPIQKAWQKVTAWF